MGDDFLRFIPTDPRYVPESDAADAARHRLESLLPDADQVTVTLTDHVEFVDQGTNFERVSCPRCGAELDPGWWGGEMSASHTTAFAHLDVTVPCCNAKLSLNDLN
jgi:hypothetical protein